ncbi:MAG: ABC transporter ATP-binding protein [Proteobacteria bacterium]|nr:MAG: ABC transporter ATP-binding protein [Pseudomonadota bacterium]
MTRFDRQALKRLATLAKPFFISELKWKACGLLLLIGCFSMSVSGVNVMMSYIGRDFMTSLSLKDEAEFFKQLYLYLGAFALATPIVVFYRYSEERLGLMWRRWLSTHILKRYFANHSYYRLNWFSGIDNPDQRIEEDIRSFCVQSLSFLLIIFNSCIALFAFMGILWTISVKLTIAVVLYAFVGSLLTYFLGRPLIGLNFAQLKKEADYRYKLINVRDNAESIAFFKGEAKEFTRTRQRLKTALTNLLSIINWNRNLNFFTTGYNYLVTILPTIIVAPLYLEGKIEFGVVTQAGFAFGQVLGALSIIVLNFGSLSAFAAVVNRLGSFWEALDEVEQGEAKGVSIIQTAEEKYIAFEDVTIYTPNRDQKLVERLSFVLIGQSLLITGPSGSGKSSLLRALAGLWSSGDGRITRPNLERSIFLPQRPYMILGTLRHQLLYAQRKRGRLDSELLDVLKLVKLEDMFKRVGGFDVTMDWSNVLSTGEQQRLAFARLILFNPNLAFLDEATTALDSDSEELIYQALKKRMNFYVSVGYRSTLAKYHDLVLELKGDGTWRLQ